MSRLVVVALVACSNGTTTSPPAPSTPPRHAAVRDASAIPAATRELVTALVDDWSSTTATLQLWSRDATDDAWHAVGDPWPAVIGGGGAAWGDGLHGRGAPAGRAGPRKHEGDGKSPAGSFALRGVYGYAATPPPGTAMSYISTTAGDDRWQCVDDPASTHYAEILDRRRTPAIDWRSAEQMRRTDARYTWVVDVSHNPDRTPGDGSCIFLHVWEGADSTTVGCTAMAEPQLAHLIGVLDPRASPLYVLLPRAEYAALARPWGLPAQAGPATLRP